MKTPWIPRGCDQQGRMPTRCRSTQWPHIGTETQTGPLTEAELDAHIAEFHAGPAPLGYEAADPSDAGWRNSTDFAAFAAEASDRQHRRVEWPAVAAALIILGLIAWLALG